MVDERTLFIITGHCFPCINYVVTHYDFIMYISLVLRWMQEAEGNVQVNNIKVSVQHRKRLLSEFNAYSMGISSGKHRPR
jgi:hypothetical protein